ncbi:calcium-binding protein, partial [Serratia sp. DD3]|uniref:calcium-binding protein n=1 Tax=Serratia sp. DD3 TaxID=1410619 RepID=UPI00056D742E
MGISFSNLFELRPDNTVHFNPSANVNLGLASGSISADGTVTAGLGNSIITFSGKGQITQNPDGSFQCPLSSFELSISSPDGNNSVSFDFASGGLQPHPTDPYAPDMPSLNVTTTSTFAGTVVSEYTANVTTDDFFDREVGGFLSGGLLGNAYTAIRHRHRDIDEAVNGKYHNDVNRDGSYRVAYYDPLLLDLDGDGLETTGMNGQGSVKFDHNQDGLKTASGWVKSDDGILVFDRNGDGAINNGNELFGDNTFLSNGEKAQNGFAALADLDTNGDGKIDANDQDFANLKVWRDLNQDGTTDSGELFTLGELGIASLNLDYKNVDQVLDGGNRLTQIGTYTTEDGSVYQMSDVNLVSNSFYSSYTEHITLTADQAKLANIQGQGRLRDLNEAATLSSDLAAILNQYSLARTREEQLGLLDQLVLEWAKTDPEFGHYVITSMTFEDQNSSNVIWLRPGQQKPIYLDDTIEMLALRKELDGLTDEIRILDAFTGVSTHNINLSVNGQKTIDSIKSIYQEMLDYAYEALLIQTRLKPYLSQIEMHLADNGDLIVNYDKMNLLFQDVYRTDIKKGIIDLAEMIVVGGFKDWDGTTLLASLVANTTDTATLNSIFNSLDKNTLNALHFTLGSEANDVITNNLIGGYLFGGAGDDKLYGRGTFNGGTGNDYIAAQTSSVSDTFLFNLGDGADVIDSYDNNGGGIYAGKDKIVFGKEVTAEMVGYRRESNHLIITVGKQGDQVTINNYFAGAAYRTINRFEFADGTVWDNISARGFTFTGSDEADNISTSSGTDRINASAGNDTLTGNYAGNYLDGGAGDDKLYGRGIFNGGSGDDYLAA